MEPLVSTQGQHINLTLHSFADQTREGGVF